MYIGESDKISIRQVIEKQLQAFEQGDINTAYALTSPTVQSKFEPQDFMQMMQKHYGAIVKPRSIMFRRFTLVDNFPALSSMIMNREGSLAEVFFVMQLQPDFSWQIHNYQLIPLNEKIV